MSERKRRHRKRAQQAPPVTCDAHRWPRAPGRPATGPTVAWIRLEWRHDRRTRRLTKSAEQSWTAWWQDVTRRVGDWAPARR